MDSAEAKTNAIELDDLLVDFRKRSVSRHGELLAVTARSFELLRYLIGCHPRIASAREIIAGVWPDSVVSGDALTQRVKLLRRQLGGDGSRYVSSVHGVGYRLAPEPRPCGARAPAPLPSASPRQPSPGRYRLLAATLAIAIAGGLLAGGVLVVDGGHALKHAVKHRLAPTR